MKKLKRRLFEDKRKKVQKKEYMLIKKRIKKEEKEYGGKFLSDTYINSREENCKTFLTWFDGYFLSEKSKNLYFNVTFLNIYSYIDDFIENIIFSRGDYNFKTFDSEKLKLIENIDNLNIDFFEGVTFEKGYSCGQGMTMFINAENLNQESVERAISQFRSNGEKPYKKDISYMKEEILKNYKENFLTKGEMANQIKF